MSQNYISNIIDNTLEENNTSSYDVNFYKELVLGTAKNATDLDASYEAFLDRPLADLGIVEKAVLRVAVYELTHCIEVPYRVVINEAIEIAKTFAADDSHKFINGVLDKAVKQIRPHGK